MFKKLLAYMGFIPYEDEKEDRTTTRIIEFPNCEEEKEDIIAIATQPIKEQPPIQCEPEITSSKPRREKYDGTFIGDRGHMLDRHDKITKRKYLRDNPEERRPLFHGSIFNVEKDIKTLREKEILKNFQEVQKETVKKVMKKKRGDLPLKNVK